MASIPSEKRSRLRSSGILKMLNAPLAAIARLSAGHVRPEGRAASRPRLLRRGRALRGLRLLVHRQGLGEELHLPARLLDRGARAGRDAVHLHGDGALQRAVAEHHDAVAVAADEARLLQRGRVDHPGQPLEIGHLDLLELAPVDVVETELRQAPLERHLPALEALEVHVARAGLLALTAAAGGLAEAGRLATTDPLLDAVRALGRLQVRQGHEGSPFITQRATVTPGRRRPWPSCAPSARRAGGRPPASTRRGGRPWRSSPSSAACRAGSSWNRAS